MLLDQKMMIIRRKRKKKREEPHEIISDDYQILDKSGKVWRDDDLRAFVCKEYLTPSQAAYKSYCIADFCENREHRPASRNPHSTNTLVSQTIQKMCFPLCELW